MFPAYDPEKMGEWCYSALAPLQPHLRQTWAMLPSLWSVLSRSVKSQDCRALARMALVSSLLFSSLSLHTVLGVITNQGPRWPVEDDEDVEVSDTWSLFHLFLMKSHFYAIQIPIKISGQWGEGVHRLDPGKAWRLHHEPAEAAAQEQGPVQHEEDCCGSETQLVLARNQKWLRVPDKEAKRSCQFHV